MTNYFSNDDDNNTWHVININIHIHISTKI